MSDPGMFIKAGEPERLSGHEQGETWRIPLNIEPNVEWRRRFLRTAHADGLFAGRKIAVQCAALIVELDGAPHVWLRSEGRPREWMAVSTKAFCNENTQRDSGD